MAKHRAKRKSPSRKRYEEKHRTRSCRLDTENDNRLEEHLQGTGHSFADFVKDHLGREEAMIDERVEMLASRRMNPSLEDRVRCLEDLVHQVFLLTVDTDECPPLCPHCEDEELCRCEGRQMESKLAQPWVLTWKCPKCGFFLDTYRRIAPKSIK